MAESRSVRFVESKGSRCRSLGMMQIQLASDARGTGCNNVCQSGVTIGKQARPDVPAIKRLPKTIDLCRYLSSQKPVNCDLPPLPLRTRDGYAKPQRSAKESKSKQRRSTRPVGRHTLAPALRPARTKIGQDRVLENQVNQCA